MMFYDVVPIAGLLIFMVLLLNKTIMLRANGITVRAGKAPGKASRLLLYPLFVAMGLLILHEITAPITKNPLQVLPPFLTRKLFSSVVLDILGTTMILAALVLLFVSLRHFKNSLRFGLDENNLGKLITNGVFALSRNPLFLSLMLYFLGVALLMPHIFFLGTALLAIVAIHLFILKEEQFMLNHYGDKYRNYMGKTPRYFRLF